MENQDGNEAADTSSPPLSIESNWSSIITVSIAMSGIVAPPIMYYLGYKSLNKPIPTPLLTLLFLFVWNALPYLAILWAAHRLSQRRTAANILFSGTSVVSAVAGYAYFQDLIVERGQFLSGISLAVLPVFQWIGLAFTSAIVFTVTSWFSDKG